MRTIALVLSALALFACAGLEPAGPDVGPTVLSDDAYAEIASGKAVLIDVRLPAERVGGSPAPSSAIPFAREREEGGDEKKFAEEVRRTAAGRSVILICRFGVRSRFAREALAREGLPARSVADGFDGSEAGPGWKMWGLPIK